MLQGILRPLLDDPVVKANFPVKSMDKRASSKGVPIAFYGKSAQLGQQGILDFHYMQGQDDPQPTDLFCYERLHQCAGLILDGLVPGL